MVHPVIKFLFVLLTATIIISIILNITAPILNDDTKPKRIPAYDEVIPQGFNIPELERVLDPRDAGTLIEPRLGTVRVADNILGIACPTKNSECILTALTQWTKNSIEHTDALPTRAYVISPEETLLYREGDDLTISILLASLLRAEGIPTRVAITPYTTFIEARPPSGTLLIDPACASCPFNTIRFNGAPEKIIWIE